MDYVSQVAMTVHENWAALATVMGEEPFVLTSGLGGKAHWSVDIPAHAWLVFGKESAGLPAELLAAHPDRCVQIPMVEGTRGLNLSTAAGILVYEALRQACA